MIGVSSDLSRGNMNDWKELYGEQYFSHHDLIVFDKISFEWKQDVIEKCWIADTYRKMNVCSEHSHILRRQVGVYVPPVCAWQTSSESNPKKSVFYLSSLSECVFPQLKIIIINLWMWKTLTEIRLCCFTPYQKRNLRSDLTNGKLTGISALNVKRNMLKINNDPILFRRVHKLLKYIYPCIIPFFANDIFEKSIVIYNSVNRIHWYRQ